MSRRFHGLVTLFVALTASPGSAEAAPTATPVAHAPVAAAAFDQLKTLVGTWRNADRPESPLRIRFCLTAGGSVLVESWEANGKPHSLTLYHRDGPALLATHYCPQGNQPRLALAGETRAACTSPSKTRPTSIEARNRTSTTCGSM